MAPNKIIANANKKKMIKLKMAMEKLQRSLSLGKKVPSSTSSSMTTSSSDADDYDEEATWINDDSSSVPEDVKEGHFAVVVVDEDYGLAKPKRYVVPLRCLTHPVFIALLERAAEMYGFDHGGALTLPCGPSEMERILGERWEQQSF